jgi:molybdopterin synthase catalytic subunit
MNGPSPHSAGDKCRIGAEPLDPQRLEAEVRGPGRGAVATFSGVVRDHHEGRRVSHLEYEAYVPMALKVLAGIVEEAAALFGGPEIRVAHRLGRLDIGETSVVVSVAAAHRKEALAACAYVIDALKERVPIWKKEFGDDGTFWIEGPGSCRAG